MNTFDKEHSFCIIIILITETINRYLIISYFKVLIIGYFKVALRHLSLQLRVVIFYFI